MAADELTAEQLAELALQPKKVTGDQGSVETRSADEIIKLANYAAQKKLGASRSFPIRHYKLVPPGAD